MSIPRHYDVSLKDIDAGMDDRIVVRITGPQGAGKTTLATAICALVETSRLRNVVVHDGTEQSFSIQDGHSSEHPASSDEIDYAVEQEKRFQRHMQGGNLIRIEDEPTLRDHFAMHALNGLLSDVRRFGGGSAREAARLAYQCADLMMEARKK